ncbi:general substrate transporter [Gamsiella multidivaricata]|uniref:general substrate transporter n=1 Tax=Gamsiella multidivaricata TaxID=101098 RepID=UPI00221ED32C|nr:general substrate transporter [Gamsiella multidivaricata]KAI7819612.1 general substrate transporter [Gamsiella multidivaricata]
MDSREAGFPAYMIYCGLVASLTSLSIGYVIGSPNVPEKSIRGFDGACGEQPYTNEGGFPNCFEYSDLLWGFAVGSFCLGALVGGLSGGTVQNIYGRRKTMFISNLFFIVGALLLGLTYHQAQFIVGRIIVGFACGLGGVVAPTYLGEISTIKGRGAMGTMYQLLIVVGILISNLIGLGLSRPPLWRILLAINGIPPMIQLFMLPSLVESPRWLVSKNRLPEARHSLQKLRGTSTDVEHEFADMVQLLLGRSSGTAGGRPAASDSAFEDASYKVDPEAPVAATATGAPHNYSIFRLFSSECRGLAIIGIIVHFFQQASGINGLIYYSTSFLGDVFGADNAKYITVGTSACNLLATLASVFLVDRTGRRTLLLISLAGVAGSSILLVIGAYTDVGILVVVSVFLYIAFFAIGLGPIPWLLLSELLPTYALSPASSVATAVNWGTNFVIGLVFPSLNNGLGNGTFILFAAITAAGFLYIWFFVPETRARPVEEIMAEKGVAPRTDYL